MTEHNFPQIDPRLVEQLRGELGHPFLLDLLAQWKSSLSDASHQLQVPQPAEFLEYLSHRLKGIGTLGFYKLVHVADKVETFCRNGQAGPDAQQQLQSACADALVALTAMLNSDAMVEP